jgi:cytochrome P450
MERNMHDGRIQTLYTPPRSESLAAPFPANPGPLDYVRYFRTMNRNPLEMFTENYFDESLIEGQFLGAKYMMVQDPDLVHTVLVTHSNKYCLAHLRRVFFEGVVPDGLFVVEGERWKSMRRLMSPVFAPRQISKFVQTMRRVVVAHADGLAARDGETIQLGEMCLELTLDVLIACLFPSTMEFDRAKMSRTLDKLLTTYLFPHWLTILRAPEWIPRYGRDDERRLQASLRDQARVLLSERRAQISKEQSEDTAGTDFLSLLLRAGQDTGETLSDDEIIDNLVIFIGAGHETTARSLTWMFYILSQAPDVLSLAREEIANADLDATSLDRWDEALPYCVAIIKESLRLYPPAPNILRMAVEDHTIGDLSIKANTVVGAAPWVIQRHHALWRDPHCFDPTRFLDVEAQSIHKFAYMPFGAGPRVCIGAKFSMQEILIVLVEFLKRFDLIDDRNDPPEPVMRLIIQPKGDLKMRVRCC